MKIAILTMFNGLDSTYSLVNVVKEQLLMLLENNIQVKMLVSEHLPDVQRTGVFADERIEWIKITNSKDGVPFHWKTYSTANSAIEPGFFEHAEQISKDYIKYLQDVDFCFMHDILYQGVHLLHNIAIRRACRSLPNLRFISFTHSAPAYPALNVSYPVSALYRPMSRTIFAYPTKCGLPALAKQYNAPLEMCAAIYNSTQITFGMGEQTQALSQKIDFSQPDILIVYPARLTPAKHFEKVSQLAGYIKQVSGKSVQIIFCDFPSADIAPQEYKENICRAGQETGLNAADILFTSDCGFQQGINRESVYELFTLSNLFICPSFSESFGLTVIEAASRGNFIVLNQAVPALEELGQQLHSHFMRWNARNFGFETTEHYHPSEEEYFLSHAREIVKQMDENPVLVAKTAARKQYSNQWVFQNQILPLLKNKDLYIDLEQN